MPLRNAFDFNSIRERIKRVSISLVIHSTTLWAPFYAKYRSLTGSRQLIRERFRRGTVSDLAQLDPEKRRKYEQAVTTIASWWRKKRDSFRFIPFNPNGNHNDEFYTLLNDQTVPKQLSYTLDQLFLSVITLGNWDSPYFRDPKMHYSALNLFSAGKISWIQKTTISDIIESTHVYGDFFACPIFTDTQEFTQEAQDHLFPFLMKNYQGGMLNTAEKEQLRNLMLELPLSERYFFIFYEQKLDENGSSPSPDNFKLRMDDEKYQPVKLLNVDLSHPNIPKYHGILKFSYGLENALGLINSGIEDWMPVISRIGKQQINDVDFYSQRQARVTESAESRFLGFIPEIIRVHGIRMAYTDYRAHDRIHADLCTWYGYPIRQAIERIILLARDTFNNTWSTDIWLLRDFVLSKSQDDLKEYIEKESLISPHEVITRRFDLALQTEYQIRNLEKIYNQYRMRLMGKPILFDNDWFPSHLALCFIIDMIKNPSIWLTFNIKSDENLYTGPYPRLIKMAKYANRCGWLNQNTKENILRFDLFVRSQGPTYIQDQSVWVKDFLVPFPEEHQDIEALMEDIAPEEYNPVRNNKVVFLGFRKSIRPEVPEVLSQMGSLNISDKSSRKCY